MADALLAMFWAGVASGMLAGLGVAAVITAVWFFWPHKDPHEDIGPDDRFRVVEEWPIAMEDADA